MNEHTPSPIPGVNITPKHVESGVDHTSFADHCKMAQLEADRASTNTKNINPVVPEDRGIHLTQADIWEAELKQAGWEPMSAHPHSMVWRAPDGVLHPGPGYANSVMKKDNKQ